MSHEADWISDVMKEVTHVETPVNWIWWSLVTAISASAGHNYHLRALKGALTYKPNIYAMLLGESGLGKGFPINLAKLLIQKANTTRCIAGRSSIQAIVTELSKQKTTADGKVPFDDSRGCIINGELSAAIIADVDSLAILTDLFDGQYNPEWTNLLKMSGKEKLVNPYITALFGSSPAHFYDSIPQTNIEGGYIGRNLIIFEESRAQNVDLLENDDDEIDDKMKEYIIPHFTKHLIFLNETKGRLIPEPKAKDLFNTWRTHWRQNQQPDKTGFINRVPDHVLKVAMCLCLARYDSKGIIKAIDIEVAIKKVTGLVYANKMTTAGRGIDPLAAQSRIVLEILLRSPNYQISHKDMLAAGFGNFDAVGLNRAVTSFEQSNWVRKAFHGDPPELIYFLDGEPLNNILGKRNDK